MRATATQAAPVTARGSGNGSLGEEQHVTRRGVLRFERRLVQRPAQLE